MLTKTVVAPSDTGRLLTLTERRRKILAFVDATCRQGVPPTLRDIADHVGVNPSAISVHLEVMEKLGLIRRNAGRARSITPAYAAVCECCGRPELGPELKEIINGG